MSYLGAALTFTAILWIESLIYDAWRRRKEKKWKK